jgi:crotonobetainyl-CoA:carnitine CoA-transferase CaiB-like acyl-CoA transferase
MLLPGHDQSGSALAGVAWEEGGLSAGGKPIWPLLSLGDLGNGLLSATAVIQALYHRDRTGEGQFVDTSIVYTQLLNASSAWVSADGRHTPERPHLDAMQLGVSALCRLYRTSAGWLCLAAATDDHWDRLLRALGETDLGRDPRFDSAEARSSHDGELAATLEPVFATRPAGYWVEALDAHGVPAEVSSETFALTLFDDPEMIERGWVTTMEHPLVGKLAMIGRTIDFSETPGIIVRPPIVTGQHTREILSQLGYERDAIEQLLLEGVVTEPNFPVASRQSR